MDDLVEWLRVQLDEDERVALAAPRYNWIIHLAGDPETGEHTEQRVLDHVILHDPARVLRDIDAKRRILGLTRFDAQFPDSDGGYDSACEDVIKLLALPYDQRPGYQEAWRP